MSEESANDRQMGEVENVYEETGFTADEDLLAISLPTNEGDVFYGSMLTDQEGSPNQKQNTDEKGKTEPEGKKEETDAEQKVIKAKVESEVGGNDAGSAPAPVIANDSTQLDNQSVVENPAEAEPASSINDPEMSAHGGHVRDVGGIESEAVANDHDLIAEPNTNSEGIGSMAESTTQKEESDSVIAFSDINEGFVEVDEDLFGSDETRLDTQNVPPQEVTGDRDEIEILDDSYPIEDDYLDEYETDSGIDELDALLYGESEDPEYFDSDGYLYGEDSQLAPFDESQFEEQDSMQNKSSGMIEGNPASDEYSAFAVGSATGTTSVEFDLRPINADETPHPDDEPETIDDDAYLSDIHNDNNAEDNSREDVSDGYYESEDYGEISDEWSPEIHVEPSKTMDTIKKVALVGVCVAGIGLVSTLALPVVGLPSGTTVAGRSLTSHNDLPNTLADIQNQLNDTVFTFTGENSNTVERSGRELNIIIDQSETSERLSSWLDRSGLWLDRLTGEIAIPVIIDVDYLKDVGTIAEQLEKKPKDATIILTEDGSAITEGEDGLAPTEAEVKEALAETIADLGQGWEGSPITVTTHGSSTSPDITTEEVAKVAQDWQMLLDSEVKINASKDVDTSENGALVLADNTEGADKNDVGTEGVTGEGTDRSITLTNADKLAISTLTVDDDGNLSIIPKLDTIPEGVKNFLASNTIANGVKAHVENASPPPEKTDPLDEVLFDTSKVTGDVVIDSIEEGFIPDQNKTFADVIATGIDGGGEVEISKVDSDIKTPESLGIKEPVSTFTSFFRSGQSRVTNIRRMAELIDNTVVAPGQSFELNNAVGPRTRKKGFVEGGALAEGRSVQDVGGGLSQFATTFFNAAWFSGVMIPQFKAHSQYFSRYPAGREATLDYPSINLEIVNDTPYSILIDTSSTESSVTVTYWSTKYWTVEQERGRCLCEPHAAFNVTWTRTRTNPEGHSEVWEVTTRYQEPAPKLEKKEDS